MTLSLCQFEDICRGLLLLIVIMAYRRCCAQTCYNTQVSRAELKFFTFPKNQEIARQWALNAGRNDLLLKTSAQLCKYLLCAEHFTKDCFVNPPHCTILRRSNFPIFIPLPTIFNSNLDNYMLKHKHSAIAAKLSGSFLYKYDNDYMEKYLESDAPDRGSQDIVIENKNNVFTKYNQMLDAQEVITIPYTSNSSRALCRLCANQIPPEQLINIFNNESSSIIDKLCAILQYKIAKNDGLPKHICISCKNDLELSVNIIEGFHRADVKLKAMNLTSENSSESKRNVDEFVLVENEITFRKSSKFFVCDNMSNICEKKLNNEDNNYFSREDQTDQFTVNICNEPREVVYYGLDEILNEDAEDSIIYECTSPIEMSQNQESQTETNCRLEMHNTNCGNSFQLLSMLDEHTKNFYQANLDCSICKKSFPTSASLKKHMIIHSDRRNILCSICGKFLADNQTYKQHLYITHSSSRPYECLLCHKYFKTERNMKLHRESHDKRKKYQCSKCYKKFHLRSLLRQHCLIHSSIKKHVCTLCGFEFNRLGNLQQHYKSHRRQKQGDIGVVTLFQCKICKKVLKSELLYKSHVIKHTGERKSFLCEFCDKKFHNSEQWAVHNRLHTGIRPYACKICGQTFRGVATLRQHSLLHSDIFPHSCQHCERKFKRLQSLNVHLKTHTGEKPFSCPTCSRAFAQKGDMLKHTKIHKKSSTSQEYNMHNFNKQIDHF